MDLSQHGVTAIELCTRYTSNDNQRTIRITSRQWNDTGYVTVVEQITFYGDTDALEALPRSYDFCDHSPLPATPSPQVDIEDYLRTQAPAPVDHIAADLDAAVALDEASEGPDPAYIDAHPGPSVEDEQPSLAKSEIF